MDLEPLRLIGSFLAGGALGAVYFYGLFLTVRRLPGARRPALLMMGSFLGRTAVVLAGLYLVMGGGVWFLAAAVAGFLIARVVLVKKLGPAAGPEARTWT
jgi:F1F0 ATPase subunit 2